MNCIIVDDEPLAREGLQEMIAEISGLTILGTFSNAPAALTFLETNCADLVFLDIQMPKVSGLDFAARLPKDTMIIFITAYSQYALNSYDLDAIDYLLKPVDQNRLQRAITKAQTYKGLLEDKQPKPTLENSGKESLLIKADRRFYKISYKDILLIEGLKDYVVIHTEKQKLITAMNLKAISLKIPADIFLRVSKSYIVNLSKISSFDSHNIYINDIEIPLGELYKNDFLQRYLQDFND